MTVDIIDRTNIDHNGVYTATAEHSDLRKAFRKFWLINDVSTGYMYDGMVKGKNCYPLDNHDVVDLLDFALYKSWIVLALSPEDELYSPKAVGEIPTCIISYKVQNLRPTLDSLAGPKFYRDRQTRVFSGNDGNTYSQIHLLSYRVGSSVTMLSEPALKYPSGKGGSYFALKNDDITP